MPDGDMNSQSAAPVLTTGQRLAYSVGHVLNDLCASMWFTYMLVFFHFVLRFDNQLSGILILVGQVADALSTPIVGLESDSSGHCCGYGRRKTWHLVGTVCVVVSFPFLFLPCLPNQNAHQWAQAIYYAPFIVLFQFGWASTQISHLSLISDLTPVSSERCGLNAYRNAASVISNLVVYLTTWAVLGLDSESHFSIRPDDADSFRNIMLIMVAIGLVCSTIFHIFVREPQQNFQVQASTNTVVEEESPEQNHVHLTATQWLKKGQFYKIALLYMCTRLYNNVTQVYMPLYLTETLGLTATSIAFIPFTSYLSGFVASIIINMTRDRLSLRMTYLVGAILGLGYCAWVYFGPRLGPLESYSYYEIYGVATLLGLSGNTVLVMSLAITNDLIGKNTKSGAFVFGAMSFTDKLANGFVIILIQYLAPTSSSSCDHCVYYHEYVLVITSGFSLIFALIALAMLSKGKIGGFSGNDHLPKDPEIAGPSETTPLLGSQEQHPPPKTQNSI